jgi:hypothetical protein
MLLYTDSSLARDDRSWFVAERVWVKWVFKSSTELGEEQSLQALILAAIAIVLLLQSIVLAGIAKLIYRARKPLEALMARAHGFLEIVQRAVEQVDRELDKLGVSLTSGPSKRHDG